MWIHRIKLALRYLWKEKTFTGVNIFGLALGLAAALAIFIYAGYHQSFDRFHPQAEKIFRLLTIDRALGVSSSEVGITTPAAGPTAFQQIPSVESQVRVLDQDQNLLRVTDRSIYAERFAYADSNFFEFFNFPLKSGNASSVLRAPNMVLLSETLAAKLFPDSDPIGQQIEASHTTDPVQVEGVFEDFPSNSHLQYDMIVSIIPTANDTNTANFLSTWQSIAAPTYLRLKDPDDWENVTSELLEIGRENNYGENFDLTMQPLLRAHLYSTELLFDRQNRAKTDIGQIRNLVLVAIFLLLIAAFNFMNLSTARSSRRAKEIGMRKVLGVTRSELIFQFLIESVILVLLGLILALILIALLSNHIGINVPGGFIEFFLSHTEWWLYSAILVISLGILSGLYPAFILSGFEPIKALKGVNSTHKSGPWLRRLLVTLQFTVSVMVIIGMIIVRQQVEFMAEKDMGFSKDYLMTIRINSTETFQNASTLRDEVLKLDGIEGVAFANSLPGTGYGRTGISPEGYSGDETWIFSVTGVDQDFADVLELDLIAGRFYDREHTADAQNSLVINEAAAEALGWDDAVGKKVSFGNAERNIIGVIKNFHYVGLRYPIEPLLLMPLPNPGGTMTIKLDAEEMNNAKVAIEETWNRINPNHPFEYQFFDDQFHQLFTDDERFAQVLTSFNWLAILIACLGLLGLTAYTVQQKTREIGIRKVLGAELRDVILILSREFWWILVVANLIAIPISYYYMKQWLTEFVYRIDLSAWPFIWAALASFMVATITIGLQAVRAERIDPVNALKQE